MSRKIFIVTIILALAAIALGTAGYGYAQTQTPADQASRWSEEGCEGMNGRRGMNPGMRGKQSWMDSCTNTPSQRGDGMRGGLAEGTGPLHTYIQNALAEAFGLTVDELQARHEGGQTLADLAVEQGLTVEQFRDIMTQARAVALNQAVADGVLTQEQADWMLERIESRGFGMKNNPGHGSPWGISPMDCPGNP
jgi:hypothetical protein